MFSVRLLKGLHYIEAQYAGQTILGSPLEADFFDPSKILIEGTKTGTVGEVLVLDGKLLAMYSILVLIYNFSCTTC
jgi:hypothetical protein